MKQLNAKGKGEHSYDYRNDMLIFKIRGRDYLKSLDFGSIIIDIDTAGFITGLRVMDASEVFKLSKLALSNIKGFEFNAKVEEKVINIQVHFNAVLRNKPVITQGQDFVREALDSNIADSEVVCSVG
jgi:hypothetical protein